MVECHFHGEIYKIRWPSESGTKSDHYIITKKQNRADFPMLRLHRHYGGRGVKKAYKMAGKWTFNTMVLKLYQYIHIFSNVHFYDKFTWLPIQAILEAIMIMEEVCEYAIRVIDIFRIQVDFVLMSIWWILKGVCI